nr:DUF3017 domain-containing protein [Propionibacterium sp.]
MTSRQAPRGRVGRHHFRPPDPRDLVDHPVPVDGEESEYPRPPRPWYQQLVGQWPLVTSTAVVLAGVSVGAAGAWRIGSTIAGAGVLLAALLRLVLPRRLVGLLETRSRTIDVLVTTLMGAGIVIVAWTVSPARH